ncbi:PGPGW domain-containing protein [Schlesneria paludicola]|uniref:PGPGW domain-containing protein n=1 Tax=Schlesneria paludicola TaxID=360056 RepID=UPI00029B2A0C|nr:PGPGW domain-containing protein [Schlesneria paludicola]
MTNPSPQPSDDQGPNSPGKIAYWLFGHARRVVVFIVGTTVLLIGIAMILLPGPAFIVIPAGLGILATEFVWAKRWLEYAKRQVDSLAAAAMKATSSNSSADKTSPSSTDKTPPHE